MYIESQLRTCGCEIICNQTMAQQINCFSRVKAKMSKTPADSSWYYYTNDVSIGISRKMKEKVLPFFVRVSFLLLSQRNLCCRVRGSLNERDWERELGMNIHKVNKVNLQKWKICFWPEIYCDPISEYTPQYYDAEISQYQFEFPLYLLEGGAHYLEPCNSIETQLKWCWTPVWRNSKNTRSMSNSRLYWAIKS